MKRLILMAAALIGAVCVVMTSCEEYLPQGVQEQFEEKQSEAKEKVSDELKKALMDQVDEFFQSDDLEESLGFSEEQLEETKQAIDQYIQDYDFDSGALTQVIDEMKNLFEGTDGLSKEEIQKKLDEMLQQ
ncbi:MAG: hypothetical protein MR531_10420 [Lachnospiraceae bacterium]|nr:hypothetical protein [Lachnospiraceae bacterium]